MACPPLAVLAAILACAALAAGEAPGAQGVVVDQPVRFVNDHVITVGDIRSRNGVRTEMYRRAGKVLPDTAATLIAFNQATLEELTDEELFVQKADELKVQIDRDRIGDELAAEAKARGLTFRELATLRAIRERQSKIDSILGWFESRAASPGPEQLHAAYNRQLADFTRPPRAQTLLIALRPTPADERQATVKAMAGLMRSAQGAEDPDLRQAATDRLDAFLAADSTGQERILAELVRDLASRPVPVGKDATLIADAVAINARWNAIADLAQCREKLEALRLELLDLPPPLRGAVFRDRAERISQGPHAADGGELGWVEPGTYGAEIATQILALPPFEPSEPFASGGTIAMVMAVRREEGRTQGFAEVSSILLAGMERDKRDEIRRRVAKVLRSQASVRDVVALKDLVR